MSGMYWVLLIDCKSIGQLFHQCYFITVRKLDAVKTPSPDLERKPGTVDANKPQSLEKIGSVRQGKDVDYAVVASFRYGKLGQLGAGPPVSYTHLTLPTN